LQQFISYDFLSHQANHCLDLPKGLHENVRNVTRKNLNELNVENIKDCDIIFVKTDMLSDKIIDIPQWIKSLGGGPFKENILPQINKKFILITGISDASPANDENYHEILENPYLIKWFTTNPPIEEHPKLDWLPIGFTEEDRFNGNPKILNHFWKKEYEWNNKKNKIFIPYHSEGTHPQRKIMIENLKNNPLVEVGEKMNIIDYYKKMSEYKFIISLRGNGWDCCRHYESLLIGSVPIMDGGPIPNKFKQHNLPVLDIDQIDESIFDMKFDFSNTKQFLTRQYHYDRIEKSRKV